ncbi:MAG: hypothetical protein ACX93O_07185 [Flagellimonas sp.]
MNAQGDHKRQDASHAQQMHARLKLKEKQDKRCASSCQEPGKIVKELVHVIIGYHLVQNHQKNDTAYKKRVFPFLDGWQKDGMYHTKILQDQEKDNGNDNGEDKNGEYVPALGLQGTIGCHHKIHYRSSNRYEQRVKEVRDNVVYVPH